MSLPSDFQFSQGALQDFSDCRRRFELKYVQALSWPALAADPALEWEQRQRLGVQFHRLVQQHQLGLPRERLTALAIDPQLRRWWDDYLMYAPSDLPPQRHPEVTLSAPLAGRRLVAKYDLIAVAPDARCVIVDWKTQRQRPARARLQQRWQTRVYRYLLVAAGAHLFGGKGPEPEQVEMVYWFSEHPKAPERLAYDRAQFDADHDALSSLIETILRLSPGAFPLTEDLSHCRFCSYRSLCERGVAAGLSDGNEDAPEPPEELDLDDIEEVVF